MEKVYSEKNKQEVLGFLKGGYKLNALIAHREFGHIGSTLAGIISELRLEGWDIKTKLKKGPKSGRKYAEYTLSPNWQLVGEEVKRQELKDTRTKKLSVRNFKIGDGVRLITEVEVFLTGISFNVLSGIDKDGRLYLFTITEIRHKTNKVNMEAIECLV